LRVHELLEVPGEVGVVDVAGHVGLFFVHGIDRRSIFREVGDGCAVFELCVELRADGVLVPVEGDGQAEEEFDGRDVIGIAGDVLFNVPGVVGTLHLGGQDAGQAGGLAGDGVAALRIGQILVKAEPERDAGAGRAAGGGDALRVDAPFAGL